jgi:inorganic pyrophosphatase
LANRVNLAGIALGGKGIAPDESRAAAFRQAGISKIRVNPGSPKIQNGLPHPLPVTEFHQPFHFNMSLDNVTPGKNVPESFNVVIEIPMNADPIKYEVDKETGAIFVDRFMSTAMHYPTNYGYVPKTLSGDGDPVDVLVITPVPLIPGVVVPCRAIGILKMQDEAGEDGKVLAVPIDKILSIYTQWQKPSDLNPMRLNTIQHFFEHYKDLEPGKWVKIIGWEGPEAAHKEILDGVTNYNKTLA